MIVVIVRLIIVVLVVGVVLIVDVDVDVAASCDFTGDGRRDVWSDNPRDALASAHDTWVDLKDEVRGYVRAKPLGTLAVAGAVGFALALLLRRSR